ncbi:unnamed protein product [Adineta ricciae]|uniref:Uncharacterized protein n=2 Tax=Adineta ricciae TaxID=249248 RepID=A0A815V6V4_ADIRI|nr:unnamed protein product [Adineta ricciae]
MKRLTNYVEHGEDNQILSYKNTNFTEIELEPIQTTENNIANLHVPFSTRSSAGVDNCQKDTSAASQPLIGHDDDEVSDEEVSEIISNTDDPTTLVLTFRSWFLGLLCTCLLSFANQFFSYRTTPLVIGTLVPQLLTFPLANIMTKCLPKRTFKIFRWEFSLNPGPFTIKEHCIITVMAVVTCSTAPAVDVLTIERLFYKRTINPVFGIIFVVTSQTLGYGIAGMMRKFLVRPAAMIWPANFVNCALFQALHEDNDCNSKEESNKVSRWKMSRLRGPLPRC